jgi:outer membrane protein OmpA-like peptidoglycan-associated protein
MNKLIILFCFVVLVVCAVVAHARLTTVQQPHTFSYGGIAEGVTRPAFVIVERIKNRVLRRALPESSPEPEADPKPKTNKATEIYFAINSSELTETAKQILDSIDRNIPVSVTGFACPLGPPAWNKRLAQLRAYKAAQYLRYRDVPVTTVQGKGGYCLNGSDISRNRRVLIKSANQEIKRAKIKKPKIKRRV